MRLTPQVSTVGGTAAEPDAPHDRWYRASVSWRARFEPFRVEVYPERDRVRVAPVGELDIATAGQVEQHLRELHDAGFDHILLDLGKVSFMDCVGLEVVLGAHARAVRQAGRFFEVIGAPAQARRLFALAGVDRQLGPADRLLAEAAPVAVGGVAG